MVEGSLVSLLGYSEKSCLASIMSINMEGERHSTDDECDSHCGCKDEEVKLQDFKSFAEIHLMSRSVSESQKSDRRPETQPQCFSCTLF